VADKMKLMTKVVLYMVISPNGMIAREDGQEDWLPHVGWLEFLAEAKKFNNIVIGRETYELVTKYYDDENFDDVDVELKIIVSRNHNFKAPAGYVLAGGPQEAVKIVEQRGMKELYLSGGGKLNSAFIKAGLVDEIHLTITPYIIGRGRSFVGNEDFDLPLKLVSCRELSSGRLAVQYKVVKK
jgi:dihydrofolate reductase